MDAKKKVIFGTAVFVVVFVLSVFIFRDIVIKNHKNGIKTNVVEKAEELGFKDVKIASIEKLEYEDNGILEYYNVTIDSSNFSDLSTNEMFLIDEEISGVEDVMSVEYTCKGDIYIINPDMLCIYKNGSEIYSDYDNSETHKSAEGNSASQSQSEVTNGDEIEIWVCAQDVVENNLKSPSSADFCSINDATVYSNGGDNYTVYGYVDAENGFGAEIRTDFTVTLTYTGSGYTNEVVVFE